jgi:hypothetical protein
MADTNAIKEVLTEVDKAITDKGGILEKITNLMDAQGPEQNKAIVGLIGSVIGLVIKCIKVAV